MKVLNLYAGIGGNRNLWEDDHQVTAVEFDTKIAAIYQDLYPKDQVIVCDAHEFLLKYYKQFDFIWSSPPCPSHSVTNHFLNPQGVVRYPDMNLYQEIILLKHFFKGKYVIENVKSYYKPLIEPQISGRHYFWANFKIPNMKFERQIGRMNGKKAELGKTQGKMRGNNLKRLGIDLNKYDYKDKDKLLRNCVAPEIGKIIFDRARDIQRDNNKKQGELF